MKNCFKARRLSENVYWVGAIDWGIRDFHGYKTSRGTTYNAYLVLADKITLIDTVKKGFFPEMATRIRDVVEPEKIDYIVSNHSEMDHAGCLPETYYFVKPEKVVASAMGCKALAEHFRAPFEIEAVKTGDKLSLGNMTLSFIETRMLHWPDSMFTVLEDEKVLFSQDAFGMHLAGSERFADEVDTAVLKQEGEKYFANILLPYSALVTKLLGDVAASGLDIDIIAPDHGPVWRKDLDNILGWYGEWAKQTPKNKALIAYDTMWGATELLAQAIADGASAGGAQVKILPLSAAHRSDVATEILDAGALVVGSSTLNNNLLPAVIDVLTYLKGLKPKNLSGFAFGSYGWSGEATRQIDAILKEIGVETVREPLTTKYTPDEDVLSECFEAGGTIAAKLADTIKSG